MFDCSAAAMGKAGQSSAGVSQAQAVWLHRLRYANGWNDSTAMQRLRSHMQLSFSLFTAFN